ncbi:MAG TPA: hypothetical protein EYP98_19105 [Planctomycetes bacterium]|nr:hypothetical protein [Planctomycetota bacterium]
MALLLLLWNTIDAGGTVEHALAVFVRVLFMTRLLYRRFSVRRQTGDVVLLVENASLASTLALLGFVHCPVSRFWRFWLIGDDRRS